MKIGLYAGSFDPWSIGHQYVLDSALVIFDAIHVVVGVNPFKQNILEASIRARLVAHAIDPTHDWWKKRSPFNLKNRITVSTYDGLVADYAKAHDIKHLIRGLRSTTDFEAEFNMYFANQAIDCSLQTWAIMCPPRLLHCSSTYIRAVVGKRGVKFVGTSFAAQASILKQPCLVGQLYDLVVVSETAKMDSKEAEEFHENLQIRFSDLIQEKIVISDEQLESVSEKLTHSRKQVQESIFYYDLLREIKCF